jgi:hypothetical protein
LIARDFLPRLTLFAKAVKKLLEGVDRRLTRGFPLIEEQFGLSVILRYCESVKNVTLSLPDDVYRRARVRAAEEDTSLSGLVQRLLMTYTSLESDFERRKRLQAEVLGTITEFRAGTRLSREEVHER